MCIATCSLLAASLFTAVAGADAAEPGIESARRAVAASTERAGDALSLAMHDAAQTVLATPPAAAIEDAVGDAYWSRGDLTAASTITSAGVLALVTFVGVYEDVLSANWQDGDTYVRWSLDTDADGVADHSVWIVNAEGTVASAVFDERTATATCLIPVVVAPDAGGLAVPLPLACVGTPATYAWSVEMQFQDLADATVSLDRVPDSGWHGPISVPVAARDASSYVAVAPTRVLDTRSAPACAARVPIAGEAGVPADAVAVAVTLTVPSASAAGYATAWPAGEPAPAVSNVNYGTGETRANGAIVRLGEDGAIELSTSTCEGLLVDVAGAFVPVLGAVGAGRFTPKLPARAIDWNLAAGDTIVLTPGTLGVPEDATAVAVNITVDRSQGGGFVTAWAAGASQPEASVLNTDGPGQTRAAAGLVPMSSSGVSVAQNIGGRVLVDVTGYMTGPLEVSTSGLFVPQTPTRALDTRPNRVHDWTTVGV
jgi:hypothetical protein